MAVADGDESIAEAQTYLKRARLIAGTLRGYRRFRAMRVIDRREKRIEAQIQKVRQAQRDARAGEANGR